MKAKFGRETNLPRSDETSPLTIQRIQAKHQPNVRHRQ